MRKNLIRILSIMFCVSLTLGSVCFVNASEFSDDVGTETNDEKSEDTIVYEEDGDYRVLELDDKNRERLVKVGDTYITTDYDDDTGTQIIYYSEGLLENDNYTEKITVQEIEANEFNSTCIVTIENAQGITIQEYDENDNITKIVDDNGKVTVNCYDEGRLTSTITPYKGTSEDELNRVSYKYSTTGKLVEEKTPIEQNEDGSISYYIEKYEYNDYGDIILYEKTINNTDEEELYSKSEYEYDERGNLLKTTEYDTDGSVLAIAQYYYDEAGNRVRQYTGLTDSLVITGLDEVTPGTDTEYSVTKYEYNEGQLISETDPTGQTESYEYDEYGLLSAKTDKNGNRFEYTYREGMYRESEKVYLAGNRPEYRAVDIDDELGEFQ